LAALPPSASGAEVPNIAGLSVTDHRNAEPVVSVEGATQISSHTISSIDKLERAGSAQELLHFDIIQGTYDGLQGLEKDSVKTKMDGHIARWAKEL
jgi:hypothetical protein